MTISNKQLLKAFLSNFNGLEAYSSNKQLYYQDSKLYTQDSKELLLEIIPNVFNHISVLLIHSINLQSTSDMKLHNSLITEIKSSSDGNYFTIKFFPRRTRKLMQEDSKYTRYLLNYKGEAILQRMNPLWDKLSYGDSHHLFFQGATLISSVFFPYETDTHEMSIGINDFHFITKLYEDLK